MEVFKPTLGKLGVAVVLFIFLYNLLPLFCTPFISTLGSPCGEINCSMPFKPQYTYQCGYISYALSPSASKIDTRILQVIVAVLAYSVPCLVLFLAHTVKSQQKSARRKNWVVHGNLPTPNEAFENVCPASGYLCFRFSQSGSHFTKAVLQGVTKVYIDPE